MSDNLIARLKALQDLNVQIRHQASTGRDGEPFDAQLATSGLVADQGDSHSRIWPGHSGRLGIAGRTVIWNSEEFASLRDSPHYECEAFWRFVPFETWEPIVRALITSNLAPLFDQLDAVLNRASVGPSCTSALSSDVKRLGPNEAP